MVLVLALELCDWFFVSFTASMRRIQ